MKRTNYFTTEKPELFEFCVICDTEYEPHPRIKVKQCYNCGGETFIKKVKLSDI